MIPPATVAGGLFVARAVPRQAKMRAVAVDRQPTDQSNGAIWWRLVARIAITIAMEDKMPQRQATSRSARAIQWARRRGLATGAELAVNVVLPFVVYSLLDHRLSDVGALLASSVPPILWTIAELIRHRRVDALSMIVVGGIVLSILAAFGTGSARMLQLREKLVTGVIGLVFLGSAVIGRPLIYELAVASMRRQGSDDLAQFEELKGNRYFRRTMTLMTLVWGLGLIADVAIGVVLVFTLSIRDYLLVGPFVGYAFMGALALWTFWYGQRKKREGERRRAAAAAAPPDNS